MMCLSGGDMWSRVFKKTNPSQCVSLTGKHDMKMIKQPRVYVNPGPAMAATRTTDDLMRLNYVESAYVQLGSPGGPRWNKTKLVRYMTFFSKLTKRSL